MKTGTGDEDDSFAFPFFGGGLCSLPALPFFSQLRLRTLMKTWCAVQTTLLQWHYTSQFTERLTERVKNEAAAACRPHIRHTTAIHRQTDRQTCAVGNDFRSWDTQSQPRKNWETDALTLHNDMTYDLSIAHSYRTELNSTQRLFANNRKYRDKIEHQMAGCQRGLSLSKLATHDYNNVIAIHINA